MGVKGLLPCLQSITRSVPLERYCGLIAAVDAMSWLHKGVFACDVKTLALNQRDYSTQSDSTELRCVKFAMDKAEMLRVKFGIQVLLVIDGDSLPSKKEENRQRQEERDHAFEKAITAEKSGDSRAARRFYAQACSITYKIRYELINACKKARIAFIVAPYEADAQMARLAHTGAVDLVITEDSDILAFGCPRALFKVDFDACHGQEVQLMRDLGNNETLSFKNWTHDMFVFMCILSGCDYSKGVPGIGIKLAHKVVRVHRSPSKIFSALRSAGRMPRGFEEEFWIAFRTYRHQRVFCPSKQQIEPLFPIPASNYDAHAIEAWPFLGEHIEPHVAARIADGTFHPSKKVEWNSALKGCMGYNQSRFSQDIQIRHQSPPLKQRKKDNKPKNQHENIWYKLVYGNNRGGNRQAQDQTDHLFTDQSSSNDTMFRFFKTTIHKDDAPVREKRESIDSPDAQPPLREIYVDKNANDDAIHGIPKHSVSPGHKDLPIHFHEYKSHLVGKKFKPITRKRTKRGNEGTRSSEVVEKIWEKSSTNRTQNLLHPSKESHSNGIALFSQDYKKSASVVSQSTHSDNGYFTSFGGKATKQCLQPMNQTTVQHHHDFYVCPPPKTNERKSLQSHDFDIVCRFSPYNDKCHMHNHRRCSTFSKQDKEYDEASSFKQYHKKEWDSSNQPNFRNRSFYLQHRGHHHQVKNYESYNEDKMSNSRHLQNDLKSLTREYTTVAPVRFIDEPDAFEHQAFPQALDSCHYEDEQQCSFEDSLKVLFYPDMEQPPQKKRHIKDHNIDYDSMRVFQVFHDQVNDSKY